MWMFLLPNNLVTWESDIALEEDCLGKLLIIDRVLAEIYEKYFRLTKNQ